MHPDVHTMEAHARIDQWLRDAVQARLAAQARAGRRTTGTTGTCRR